ncbi:MAG: tRNA lysidine(34) synthetase TilS, partial [Anaerolineales bacterium]
ELANRLGIPCVTKSVPAKDYAEKESLSLETASRILRYRFLFEQAEKHQAAAVAVAHTADDQVETFFLHLLRGTGIAGLRGMKAVTLPNPWSDSIPLIRPLLNVWRSDILKYLDEKHIQPFWDKSNWDNTYQRNRIRNELIPYLEEYNPSIRKLIWQTCDILNPELDLLESLEEEIWEKLKIVCQADYATLNLELFRKQPIAMQRRIMRRLWLMYSNTADEIDYPRITQALSWIREKTSGKYQLEGDLYWVNEGNRAWIVKKGFERVGLEYPQIIGKKPIPLQVSQILEIGQNWVLQIELVSGERQKVWKTNARKYEAWVDLDKCQLPLYLRSPLP